MVDIVGIRFKQASKLYYFDPVGIELEAGDFVVVETSRGLELGRVIITPSQVPAQEVNGTLKPVLRKAEPDDIQQDQELKKKAQEAMVECNGLISELQLPMKLLTAEYNLDSSRLTFLFSAEERVDFRELLRRLTKHFKSRVELRQVGSRDKAKLIGGFGRCGRPLCCMSFIDEFAPVSIKMAKEQDLPLNPMKISGVCGRLMCCLSYESEQYHNMKAKLPKAGKRVNTSMGKATVVGSNPIKETIMVELDSDATVELPLSEISTGDEA